MAKTEINYKCVKLKQTNRQIDFVLSIKNRSIY